MLSGDKRVEDCGHQEVGDTTSRVTKTCGESVGCSNNVFVEKARGPHLAWYKATTQDANEEAESE